MDHLIFYVIVCVSLALVAVSVAWRWWEWRRRWDGGRYGGVFVRFHGPVVQTAALARDLTVTNRLLSERVPFDYRVEVTIPGHVSTPTVPNGYLPSGEVVMGSVRSERAFPIPGTTQHLVAVVADDPRRDTSSRVGSFLIHEVVRHLLPFVDGEGYDPGHVLGDYADLERELKSERHARLTG